MNIKAITRLLILSLGFTVSLIFARIFYTGNTPYLFFLWNLFLAIIPLVISSLLFKVKQKKLQWLLLMLWLLFFPNALYIVTDLIHLKNRYPVPLWFDIVLIFSAAINGLIVAYISLQQVELFFRSVFNDNKTNAIIFICLFLSSFGVYLGRFSRWNSWDVFVNPVDLSAEILQSIFYPFKHSQTWEMTIVLTVFFSIFYFTIKNLAALVIKKM